MAALAKRATDVARTTRAIIAGAISMLLVFVHFISCFERLKWAHMVCYFVFVFVAVDVHAVSTLQSATCNNSFRLVF